MSIRRYEWNTTVSKLAKEDRGIKEDWNESLSNEFAASHAVMGLVDEYFELQEAFLKEDHDNILEECGDFLFYLQYLADYLYLESPYQINLNIADPDVLPSPSAYLPKLVEVVKRWLYYNKPLDSEVVTELLNQCWSSILLVAALSGFTEEEVLQHNADKLNKRYNSGSYSDKQANDRADKQ